jgi:hypothetical protein
MTNNVTLKTSSRLHLLVPWNSLSSASARNFREIVESGIQVENAPTVFLAINRG